MNAPDRPIGPTPERLAKAGEDVEFYSPDETVDFKAIRMLDGSPLSRLASLGRRSPAKGITGPQFNAGCRFFADAYRAKLVPSGVGDTTRERVDCEGYRDIPDMVIAAQTRYNNALKVLGHREYHILSDVVISETPLNVYADRFREYSQPRERRAVALTRLRDALDDLDAHYYPQRRAGIVSVHVGDYKPVIAAAASPSNAD